MKNLPKIALGTWSWGAGIAGGDQVFGNHLSNEELKEVFDAAMNGGLTLWDTAAAYGMGASESIIGEFVKDYAREEVLISTKFTPQLAGNSENPVATLFEESCERLNVDYIDIYWIHNPIEAPKWVSYLLPLLQSGKVKRVGVSNHNLEQIKEADAILKESGFHISAIQNHYSLLYRSSEEAGILDYCKENDVTFFAYMVLEQGVLSGKYNTKSPLPEGSGRAQSYNHLLPQLEELTAVLAEIGQTKNVSAAQIAIAWAIAKNTLPIIGVTKVSQVNDAVQAASVSLSADEMKKIEEVATKAGVDTKGAWEKPMI